VIGEIFVKVREITISDAQDFMELIQQVENNSEYMLFEPGERQISKEKQFKMIEAFTEKDNSTIFVAEEENKLVGYLIVNGGSSKRTLHSAYLVVGILKSYRGKGVGTKLFQELEAWALAHQIHRLELTVVSQNKAGLALYKKMGFEVEGTKKDSLFIAGEYVDEYYMAKLL
jgi:RimJ/RimL family protein N-acetyltransferase